MGFQLIPPSVRFKEPEAVRCRTHQNKDNGWKDTQLALAAQKNRKMKSELLPTLTKSRLVGKNEAANRKLEKSTFPVSALIRHVGQLAQRNLITKMINRAARTRANMYFPMLKCMVFMQRV